MSQHWRSPLLNAAREGALPAQPCPVCGERWQPKALSRLTSHARCALTEIAQDHMRDSTATVAQLAKQFGCPVTVVNASVNASFERKKTRRSEVHAATRAAQRAENARAAAVLSRRHERQREQRQARRNRVRIRQSTEKARRRAEMRAFFRLRENGGACLDCMGFAEIDENQICDRCEGTGVGRW